MPQHDDDEGFVILYHGGTYGDIYGGGDVDYYHIEQNFERLI